MIASLGSDVNLNRWSCLLGKPMVLLGRRVWGSGLSDLYSNWSWLAGWDYTHSRSPSCDPFCLAPWIESRTSDSSAQPRTIETVNVTNGYKHGRYYACGVVLEPPKLSIRGAGQKDCRGVWGRKLIIYGLSYCKERLYVQLSPVICDGEKWLPLLCLQLTTHVLNSFSFNPQFDRSSVYCLYQ